jgi:hypothetical protein
MATIVKNFIEISGLAETLPQNPTVFRQFAVQGTFTLPEGSIDIEQIVKVAAQVVIISTRVIRTPAVVSLEGQKLTGFKLIAEGEVRYKAEYAADECSHSVHAVSFKIPFCNFIVLPPDFTIGTPVTATGYIEDIFVEKIEKCSVFTNIIILLNAAF